MSTSQESPPPVVCTLTTKARATRRLEWGDLAALAIERTRIDGGISSTYPEAYAADIEDLVGRELDCCGSWLRFTTARLGDVIRLDVISLNPDGEEVLTSMLGLD